VVKEAGARIENGGLGRWKICSWEQTGKPPPNASPRNKALLGDDGG